MAEAHRRQFRDLPVPVGELVAHEVGAGDAEMDAPGGEFAGDLAGREQHEFEALGAVDRAGIFAIRPGATERDAAGAEPVEGLLHQPALGRHTEFQHDAPPQIGDEAGPDHAAHRRDRAALAEDRASARRSARRRRPAAGRDRRRGRRRRSRRSIRAWCGRGSPRNRGRRRRCRALASAASRASSRSTAGPIAGISRARSRRWASAAGDFADRFRRASSRATSSAAIGGAAASSRRAARRAAISASARRPMSGGCASGRVPSRSAASSRGAAFGHRRAACEAVEKLA